MKIALALSLFVLFLLIGPPARATAPEDVILDDTFWVNARHFSWKEVTFRRPGTLRGQINVVSGNDIEFYVMDYRGFEDFNNGKGARTFYNSGRIRLKRFEVNIPPGNHFLVFNNQFSLITDKRVNAFITFNPR